jgi:DNA-binding response OmpR family regulator
MSDTASKRIILVVEPDDDFRLSLVLYLTELGYEVLSMADGKTALKIIHEQCVPDLIVVENELPDMSLYQFCGEIRFSPVTTQIPIICLIEKLTYAKLTSRLHKMDSGVDDCITKPFAIEQLQAHIQRAFKWIELYG